MRTFRLLSPAAPSLALASLAALASLGFVGLIALSEPDAGAETSVGPVEAVFEDARGADQFQLVTTQQGGEVQMTFNVPAGSALTLTAGPDDSVATAAVGLGFRLHDPAGNDLLVAGGPNDKSKPEKDKIKWKNVPLTDPGVYTLSGFATTAGGMQARLAIAAAKTKFEEASTEDLPRNTPASVEFQGRAGDTLKFDLLKSGNKSKFKGVAVQLLEASGTLRTDIPQAAKGKIVLESDGTHSLIFLNDGTAPAAWRSKLTVKPRSDGKRNVLVSAKQTGTKPKVKSIVPEKGVHLDTALRITLTGKGFMQDMDVRLVRKKREDILATDFDFVSPEEVSFLVNLDTQFRDGQDSIGSWKMSVWNEPLYADESDRTTLDKTSSISDEKKTFKSVSAGSIKLPDGVEDNTEVWQLRFNDAFQNDLNFMGLGSNDPAVQDVVNELVQAYVVAYVRDLMVINETNGAVKGAAVPMCFIIDPVTRVAGEPGVDFNRIEIGGAFDPETDPSSPLEPLEWGFAPFDAGNTQRDDLSRTAEDGTYQGFGARTRVLDARNGNDQASASWRQAMLPLRDRPLTSLDGRFFLGRFNPNQRDDIARYSAIVNQVERAAREIAAITAHHIGRAMGLVSPGDGPMATPSFSGQMWVLRRSLSFDDTSLAALRLLAVRHELPGKSSKLKINFFPLIDSQLELLEPSLLTGVSYEIKWEYIGGRCNAVPEDYSVSYARGSAPPIGLDLSYVGLSGVAPVCFGGSCTSAGSIYCGIQEFAVLIEDVTRSGGSFLFHRIKILPTISLLPSALQAQGQACRDSISNAR